MRKVLSSMVLLLFGSFAGVLAQPPGIELCPAVAFNCTVMGATKTCTGTRPGFQSTSFLSAPLYGSNNVTACNATVMTMGGGFTITLGLTGMAMTNAAPTRSCIWTINRTGVPDGHCTLDQSDDLPVELMEFSVESKGGDSESDRDAGT